MTEEGYSWTEAILALTIVMVIFGTLLPFASHLTSKLYAKKTEMYAAEVAYKGVVIYNAYGLTTGSEKVEEIIYDWFIDESSICVSYKLVTERKMKCLE